MIERCNHSIFLKTEKYIDGHNVPKILNYWCCEKCGVIFKPTEVHNFINQEAFNE
jgi:hypothetical protein